MKKLLSGNEAIARGAWEAGVKVASAYPGTPSTEILQFMSAYDEVNSEWSPNEKVALEVGAGASMAGARTLVAMKHVGVNVAADPLFTLSYVGVKGGLVIITADDPQMHSSQNEQDNRHYARSAKIPMLEPSDSDEALRFVKMGFDMSEEYDCPVFVRSTTRVSHGQTMAEVGGRAEGKIKIGIEKDPPKWVMLPAFARMRHPLVEERMARLAELAETFPENKIEPGDKSIGIVASGVAYQYAREAFPKASFLKLGMSWPLPKELFRKFASMVDKVYVVEELDPFFENWMRALGLEVVGKEAFPLVGELTPGLVKKGVLGDAAGGTARKPEPDLPMRPPIMCPGCPHRGLFTALKKLNVFVCGDIGCYTLAAPPPLSSLDSCLCMGAGIGQSFGAQKALGMDGRTKVVSVIGDSTFFHSGVTPLMDMAYNHGDGLVIILDNRITAMTGRQQNPGSGADLCGEASCMVDLPKLAEGLGIKRVKIVEPYDVDATKNTLKEELEAPELSLVISRSPCMLIPESKSVKKPALKVDDEKCSGCKSCLNVACPAISFITEEGEYTSSKGERKKRKGRVTIDELMCTGCGVCAQVCPQGAIIE